MARASQDTNKLLVITAIVAVVVIIALLVAKKMDFSVSKTGLGLSTDRDGAKDKVSVGQVNQAEVGIKNRPGQDVEVKDINNKAIVKIE